MTRSPVYLPVLILAVAAACADSAQLAPARGKDGGALGGPAAEAGSTTFPSFGDAAATPGAPGTPAGTGLVAVIRDFRLYRAGDPATNPDFENVPRTDASGNPNDGYLGPWDDPAIVTDTLGADGKPVYASASGKTLTTHGKGAFDEWFRDVPSRNRRVNYPITLQQGTDGAYAYESDKTGTRLSPSNPQKMFFPIDDDTPYATDLGNEGKLHNYSFTVELHTTFTYHGGEYFAFRGDDDIFVYIDGRRVIDLGGIHGAESAQVDADSLGLVVGRDYPLDFFSAERHVEGSNVLFTTTLDLRPAPR